MKTLPKAGFFVVYQLRDTRQACTSERCFLLFTMDKNGHSSQQVSH